MFEAVSARPSLVIASLFVFDSMWGGPVLCVRVAARLAAPTPVGGALRGRPRLVMRRDDRKNDHYERSSRKEQHYGGGAHDGPVPACPPLLLLQRNSRRVRWTIAGGRIVQLYPGDPTPRATEKNHDASCRQRTGPTPQATTAK